MPPWILAAASGPFVATGVRTGGGEAGPWGAAVGAIGVEHGPARISASGTYGAVVADRVVEGFGQPEVEAALAATGGVVRPAGGVAVGLPLGGLADRDWRWSPWLGATLVGDVDVTAQIGLSTAPGARRVELATAPVRALAHGWVEPQVGGWEAPPPAPRLDPRGADELVARLAVGPHRDDGGRVAGTLALTRGDATGLALGLLVATPPRRLRFVGALAAPIVDGGVGVGVDARVEWRP
jgi:hypothetical protein